MRTLLDLWSRSENTSRERPKSALHLMLKKRKVFEIVKGGLLDTPFSGGAKTKKLKGDPLKTSKNFQKSLTKPKKGGSLIVAQKVESGDPSQGCLKIYCNTIAV